MKLSNYQCQSSPADGGMNKIQLDCLKLFLTITYSEYGKSHPKNCCSWL